MELMEDCISPFVCVSAFCPPIGKWKTRRNRSLLHED